MGRLSQRRSFGELSLLLWCHVSPCTLVTRTLEPGAVHGLDPITKALILQTAKPTFGDLTQEAVNDEFARQEFRQEWRRFKCQIVQDIVITRGIRPGHGKWSQTWPRPGGASEPPEGTQWSNLSAI